MSCSCSRMHRISLRTHSRSRASLLHRPSLHPPRMRTAPHLPLVYVCRGVFVRLLAKGAALRVLFQRASLTTRAHYHCQMMSVGICARPFFPSSPHRIETRGLELGRPGRGNLNTAVACSCLLFLSAPQRCGKCGLGVAASTDKFSERVRASLP